MQTKINYNSSRIDPVNDNIFDSVESRLNLPSPSVNIFIPNICSTTGDTISSFSKELYKKFPIVEASLNVTSHKKPGRVAFVDAKTNIKNKSKIIVGSMFCQTVFKRLKRPLHYGQLVFGMYEVKQKLLELQKNSPDFINEIHCPRIGVGIAGGNWNFISDLIIDIWGDFRVVVYNHLIERDK